LKPIGEEQVLYNLRVELQFHFLFGQFYPPVIRNRLLSSCLKMICPQSSRLSLMSSKMNWMDADQLNPNALGLIQSCLGSMEFCKGEYFLYGLGQRITCSYLKVTKFSSIYIYIFTRLGLDKRGLLKLNTWAPGLRSREGRIVEDHPSSKIKPS